MSRPRRRMGIGSWWIGYGQEVLKKQDTKINEWLKEVAPSTELRKWFHHEPEKWEAFAKKYAEELRASPAYESLQSLIAQHRTVTLVYSAKDEHVNQAAALKQILNTRS